MDNNILQSLARTLNLTGLDSEPEEYILTKEEEFLAISNAITAAKRNFEWKLANAGMQHMEIVQRVSEINWNEKIDKENILKTANSNKHYGIWQEQQRQKEYADVLKKQLELQEKYSAKNIFSLMKWTSQNKFQKQLIINEDNKSFITALCFFISNDPRFESELGFSFKKGLLIRGISGLGKTHLVECLADNELNPILILSMLEISESVKNDGEFIFQMGGRKIIYLDDVGTEEPVVNHYGTKINFFKNFIENYYLRNKSFNRLMISTNNSFSELEEKYGFRVRSRIKDMFNIVDVKGKDMRG